MGVARSVVIVSSDVETQLTLGSILVGCGQEPEICAGVPELQQLLEQSAVDLVFCEAASGDGRLRKTLAELEPMAPRVPVVVVCRLDEWRDYLEAMRSGAFDCVVKPFRREEVRWVASRALQAARSPLRRPLTQRLTRFDRARVP